MAWSRSVSRLDHTASQLAETRGVLGRHLDHLGYLERGVSESSRSLIQRHRHELASYTEMFSAIGIEPTLKRGFALVTRVDGAVIRSVRALSAGDRVAVRMADGTVAMTVEGAL